MTSLSQEELDALFTSLQIGPHPDYRSSDQLALFPPSEVSRLWLVPPAPGRAAHVIDAVLHAVGDPVDALLVPRSGHWPAALDRSPPAQRVQVMLLASLGVPPGHAGGVRCQGHDLIRAAIAAWQIDCVQDLYVIPLDGRSLVNVTHSQTVHIECREDSTLTSVVQVMRARGIDLPDDVPDASFKRPAWMPKPRPPSPHPRSP